MLKRLTSLQERALRQIDYLPWYWAALGGLIAGSVAVMVILFVFGRAFAYVFPLVLLAMWLTWSGDAEPLERTRAAIRSWTSGEQVDLETQPFRAASASTRLKRISASMRRRIRDAQRMAMASRRRLAMMAILLAFGGYFLVQQVYPCLSFDPPFYCKFE